MTGLEIEIIEHLNQCLWIWGMLMATCKLFLKGILQIKATESYEEVHNVSGTASCNQEDSSNN